MRTTIQKLLSIDKNLYIIQTGRQSLNLFHIFYPLYLESLLNNTLGTINTAIISAISEDAVGAIGACNQLMMMYTTLFSVIVMGVTAVVSNYLGAGHEKRAYAASYVSVAVTAVASAIFGGIMYALRRPTLQLMHVDASLLEYTMLYYGLRVLFLIATTVTAVLNALMRCYGISHPSVYSGVISNVVNLLGSVFAVYFLQDDLHAVILGLAVACALGQSGGLFSSWLLFRRHKIILRRPESRKEYRHYLNAMLKIGVPSGLSSLGYTISQTVSTSFVGILGKTALSAKIYFSTLTFYCCMFSASMGNANAVLVGHLCGKREYEHAIRLCRQLSRLTIAVNLLACLLLLGFSRPILSLFTHQEQIMAMAIGVFIVNIFQEEARAVSQIYEYALRATGDILFAMVGILISCWINGVGVSYLLGIKLGLGLTGVWIGFALDEISRAAVTVYRWRSRKWIDTNQKLQ